MVVIMPMPVIMPVNVIVLRLGSGNFAQPQAQRIWPRELALAEAVAVSPVAVQVPLAKMIDVLEQRTTQLLGQTKVGGAGSGIR